jgi:hypothetical protein
LFSGFLLSDRVTAFTVKFTCKDAYKREQTFPSDVESQFTFVKVPACRSPNEKYFIFDIHMINQQIGRLVVQCTFLEDIRYLEMLGQVACSCFVRL